MVAAHSSEIFSHVAVKTLVLYVAIVAGNVLYYFISKGKNKRATIDRLIDTSVMQGFALLLMYFLVLS